MNYVFDTLKFTQRLEQVGVAREQAIAHAELARDMVLAESATKDDVAGVRTDIENLKRIDLPSLKREVDGSLRELELRMTIKLGAMIAAAVAIAAAVQKLL